MLTLLTGPPIVRQHILSEQMPVHWIVSKHPQEKAISDSRPDHAPRYPQVNLSIEIGSAKDKKVIRNLFSFLGC